MSNELTAQELMSRAVSSIKGGEVVTVPLGTGWQLDMVRQSDEKLAVKLSNPDPRDSRVNRWFEVDTGDTEQRPNMYNAPLFYKEPTLGLSLHEVAPHVEQVLAGVVIFDESGEIMTWTDGGPARFSISRLLSTQMTGEEASLARVDILRLLAERVQLQKGGELIVSGKSYGYLQKLFSGDKNRVRGLVGRFGPEVPEDGIGEPIELADAIALL